MSIYDELAQQTHSKDEKIKRMGPALYESVAQNSKVLDVGCSSGYFAELLVSEKQCVVDGIEIDEDDIAKAKKIVRKIYTFDVEEDWSAHISTSEKYDAVIFGDVLEHLREPGKALVEAKKYLAKNGRVLVSIPNIAHISVRLELLLGSFEYGESGILDKTHLKYFTLSSFTQVAQNAGFVVERISSSLNDYPNSSIQNILKKAGLTPSDDFWRLVSAVEARSFQYKFVLKAAGKGGNNNPVVPAPKPDELKNNDVQKIAAEHRVLTEKVARLEALQGSLENTVQNLQSELHSIENSRSYKLAVKLRDTKNKLKIG